MGLFGSAGLKSAASSVASVIASLVGQDIVARSITLTQVAASNAVSLVAGARVFFGANNLSEAGNTLTWSGNNGIAASVLRASSSLAISLSNPGQILIFASDAAGTFWMIPNVSAANAGATPALAAFSVAPANALDAGDWVFNVGNGNNTTSLLAVRHDGGYVVPSSDSSGTPGPATINLPSGRSAIALGAATVTITNSLVAAGSRIFISPLARDATGLLPAVTTHGAGSFIVTTTANCTAALSFDWFVLS